MADSAWSCRFGRLRIDIRRVSGACTLRKAPLTKRRFHEQVPRQEGARAQAAEDPRADQAGAGRRGRWPADVPPERWLQHRHRLRVHRYRTIGVIDVWLELAAAMTVRDLEADPAAPRASLAAGA